jgi:hypothetical protein
MTRLAIWLDIVAATVTILLAIYTLPQFLLGTYTTIRNWWSLRSHRRTVHRLAVLESQVKKLDEPIDMQNEQIIFHYWIAATLNSMAGASLFGLIFVYQYVSAIFAKLPAPPSRDALVISEALFAVSWLAGLWGMSHFQRLLVYQRKWKREELETSIRSMQEKLKAVVQVAKP